jgi:hypothetical protein
VTYPPPQQPGPRPFPPPGGYRPAPPPQSPRPEHIRPTTPQDHSEWDAADAGEDSGAATGGDGTGGAATGGDGTGHPAVDAVLRSLANAARLAPADQIAEYEAAHRVLQETLSSIDG